MNYLEQAKAFLTKTGSELTIRFVKYGFHFSGDTEKRDIYRCTIKRGEREYKFNFGQSLNESSFKVIGGARERIITIEDGRREFLTNKKNSMGLRREIQNKLGYVLIPRESIKTPKAPNEYDILACLGFYCSDNFDEFCGDFGYDNDSIKAKETHEACLNEYKSLCALYSEVEMEQLSEIS